MSGQPPKKACLMANNDIERTLGRLEAKLDTALETLAEHKEKLGVLEKFHHQIIALVAVVTTIGSMGWHFIIAKVNHS